METWTPPNPEYPPPKPGEPAIHRAARLGDASSIRALAKAGADLNEVFDIRLDPGARISPATPLMVAAGSGDGATTETLQKLLELGADPKVELQSKTAASFACTGLGWNYRPGGDADRLRFLLAVGCPLPTDPEEANRLVCEAAQSGDLDRLSVLLGHGLSAKGYWDPVRAEEKERDLQRILADHPERVLDPFACLSEELRLSLADEIQAIEEVSDQPAAAPYSFEIPLFCAAESGSVECVTRLLDAGADPMMRDISRRTAMYHAASVDVIRALMAAGVPLEDEDGYGWSPLTDAVMGGEDSLPRVRALIEAGANVNATHDRGYTVFMSAVGSGRHPEVLRLLMAAGANPHAVSELGYNAFHAAVDVNGEANEEESVRSTLGYLKEIGVDIEHRNGAGLTPLARAIQEGTGIEVRVLCELGADPNAVCPMYTCGPDDCSNFSLPLLFHAAIGAGVHSDEKTEALLKAGADPLVKDTEGFTPLERAVANLCSEASDYEATYRSFFDGINELVETLAKADVETKILLYAEGFASTIPVSESSLYAEESRGEDVAAIASLCWYDVKSRLGF
jgi:ankyrin repeat protein